MNALKMCLNWKVITGVAVVGVALFAFAPGLALAALPFLVIAICPLSMLLMMGMMSGDKGKGESDAACSMVRSDTKTSQASGTSAAELVSLQAQQQDLARQIAALESHTSRS